MANISKKWLNELEVLVPFTSGYNLVISGSSIAKRANIPQRTASLKLNQYSEMGLLKYRREGRNKLFYFDLSLPSSETLLQMVELYKGLTFLLKNKKLAPLIEELVAKNRNVVLFGSFVKGYANKDSDVDLLVLSRKSKSDAEVFARYPFRVSVHYSTVEEFERLLMKGNTLAGEIAQYHILINLSEGFIKALILYYK